MSEAAPCHVGHMQQSIHSIEIDERTEIGDVFHCADHTIADIHALKEFLAFLAAFFFDYLAPAEHNVLPFVVQLDDFEVVRVADELLQILWGNDINLRRRQKCLNPDVHHQAAFDDRSNLAFDQAVAFENTDNFVPILAVGCFLL